MKVMRPLLGAGAFSVLATLLVGACAEGSDTTAEGGGQFHGGGAGGSGGAGGLLETGGGPSGDGASSCVATYGKADPKPLDMYIMFDKSGSMHNDPGNTGQPMWSWVTQATKAF